MKWKKRMPVLMALVLVFCMFSTVYAASGITLTLKGDILDAIGDIEYGSRIYRFDDSILEGANADDEVYLVADVKYGSVSGGDADVTFSDFRLEGMNAEDYNKPEIAEPVKKTVRITPRVIQVVPARTSVYYGQSVTSDELNELADYSDQLVEGDEVSLTAEFEIQSQEFAGGEYVIEASGAVSCDNANYTAVFDSPFILKVPEYSPEISIQACIREHDGGKYAVLTAPEGYLISRERLPEDSNWSSSIEVWLEDKTEGKVTYYLRCNDTAQTEYYRAISKERAYDYVLAMEAPEIVSIRVEKEDESAALNFRDSEVYGNGSVNITVEAVGSNFEQETCIYLGEDGSYEMKNAVAEPGDDGRFHYTAVFTCDVPQKISLQAYAENSCGRGQASAHICGVSDLDGTEKEMDVSLFVLENTKPEVEITSMDGNCQRTVKAEVTMEDTDSGIALVEYLWDTEFELNGSTQTEFVPYEGIVSDRADYEFILPWENAMKLADGCHTLHLRVTDKAGNVCCVDETDAVGSDMFPPEIKEIKIGGAADSIFRFRHSAYYSNKAVDITVVAGDAGAGYQSGIDMVALNDYKMQNSAAGEYVLAVSPDTEIDVMSITAVDKAGWEITRRVTYDSPETGLVGEVNLVVEEKAPTVSVDFEAEGYTDADGQRWFGTCDGSAALKITVSDEAGAVNSGLYSLKITDNGEIMEESVFSSIVFTDTCCCLLDEFEEGEHTIEVAAEDNAGNFYSTAFTFYIDRTLPESGGILVEPGQSIMIDGRQWFDVKDVITFRTGASDADSGLKSIELEINGQLFKYEACNFLTDDRGNYVTADTAGIDTDEENKYTVICRVTDYADNVFTSASVVVYKDFANPSVGRITVEKRYDDPEKGLNLLPHGVYANDTLVCKVYASDEEFDSGIDYVTLFYEGMPNPEKMSAGGEGVFFMEIPVCEEVFEKEIIVTAYDSFGKKSESTPLITAGEEDEPSAPRLIMLERNAPVISVDLPEGDGECREDGLVWYQANKALEFHVQDVDSGIYNISFTVNGVEIASDKNGTDLLKAVTTRISDTKITEEQSYAFDTDYLEETAGEAIDGKYLINIAVTDNAGNSRTYEAAYYMDKSAPRIDRIDFSAPASDGAGSTEEFIGNLFYQYYFKSGFKITACISDEGPSSGLNEVRYRFVPYINGVPQEEIRGSQKISDGKAELAVPPGFKGQIFLEAFDNVGNRSGEKTTRAYIVDGTSPEITVTNNLSTPYRDAVGNSLYVGENSITVEITDMVSGIREIGYAKDAEKNAYGREAIFINNAGHNVGENLGDGWIVSAVDANLVTKVAKTFSFNEDDNDVILTFDATDNSLNAVSGVTGERFTVDTTNPIINVSFREDADDTVYYNQNRIADITVIERNFSDDCISILIENTFGKVPAFNFTEKSNMEHTAVIDFDEGDYTFQVTGTDLGNQPAVVNFSGGNERSFSVDKTQPVMEENFALFADAATENSFNTDKTVNVNVTEHNFNPELTNLRVFRKSAGAEHNAAGLADVTSEVLSGARWEEADDVHTISFTLSQDAVYQVEITPSDLAGNVAGSRSTPVFEIDRTAPVVTAKNGAAVDNNNVEFLDIYPSARKDEPAPTVEFEDLNMDHISYALTVYIPDHSDPEAVTVIRPERVYLEEDGNQTGEIEGGSFALPDFTEDGVYALELSAVDVAGNESLLNVNTYARMVEQDVLAYIMDSNLEQKTGLYSFQYENGDAISMRPDNFSDIKICVLAKKDSDVDIVLRDSDGVELNTNAYAVTDDSVYGMGIYYFTLKADFFKENFQDDTDVELRLRVNNEGNRVDLGSLHIDNIAPDCTVPEEFKSWKWFRGEESRTITVSDISELLDESLCKVYDNGQEIAFRYSSEKKTLEFTLEKGWHDVGIVLSDTAGNAYNIQERTNIYIGFFWSWVIGAVSGTAGVAACFAVICIRVRWIKANRE